MTPSSASESHLATMSPSNETAMSEDVVLECE